MRIEVATSANLEEIAGLMNSGYRGEGSRIGWTTEADYFDGERTNPKALANDLSAGPGRLMLIMRPMDRETIVGCVYLENGCGSDGLSCYLGMLTVAPRAQAGGLGRRLLEAAEFEAKQLGAQRMVLGVLNPRIELMGWYERRGYRRNGETKPFPYGAKTEREKPLRDDLHFIFFEKPL